MGIGSSDFNMGQAMGSVGEAFAWQRANNKLSNDLRQKQYVANSLEGLAANRTRKIQAWDNIVWEIVKRIKDFDPETRYRILGVCKGQDASPEDTMRELRKVQDAWFEKLRAAAPKDESDTDVPNIRKDLER